MKKSMLFSALLVLFGSAHADLQSLNNQQLQQVEGQASAATINWTLSLNQTSPGVFDTTTCADLRFCRFAVATNNRYHDGSYVARDGTIYNAAGSVIPTATGRKQWVVLKGIQGTFQLQNVDIDGADLLYSSDANVTGIPDQIKAALQLTFKKTDPILIRNFGFSALSIETDTCTEANANCSTGTTNTPGYLAMGSGGVGASAYANGKYTNATNQFDLGRETGFTGMTMNGNLALQGTIKVFSCDASMKRC